ncbi:MAG TPA: hypothetical protein DCS97_11320 [Planctomycetes bacterium]|nr:hypothetical protein [Planctomycetota bacterium]
MLPTTNPLRGDDHLHVRILQAEAIDIGPWWRAREVRSAYWRLYIHDRDGAWLATGTGRYLLAGGRAHFVPAWVRFDCHCSETVRHLYVHFDPIGLPGAVVRTMFPKPFAVPLDTHQLETARRLEDQLRLRPLARPAQLCRVKALLYECLAPAFDRLPEAQAARCLGLIEGGNAMVPALRHIEDHLPEPLPNALLARLCGLAEDTFIRAFRRQIGQSPGAYVRERRIAQAAQRLQAGDEPVEDIARAAGFANRFHFTRVFTARMGCPPVRYRSGGRA